ncbi:MAG: hypothetical protein D6704_13825, partial [Nitrospirae bacterium]
LRRLARSHLPPMLNLWVTDSQRVVMVASSGGQSTDDPYAPIVQRIQSQPDLPPRIRVEPQGPVGDASVLALGHPSRKPWARQILDWCGEQVELNGERVRIGPHTFEGPEVAVLVSCSHPTSPHRVGTLFFGMSPSAVAKVARLLFFYGWDSYVIFRDGHAVARGLFAPPITEEVSLTNVH